MKTFSPSLLALLASGVPVYRVDLFKIGPTLNGQMIYACNGTGDITYDGNIYSSSAFGQWSRDNITVKVGLESNSTSLTVITGQNLPVYFPGTSQAALMNDGIKFGLLGVAPVTIYTAYMTVYGLVVNGADSLVETKFIGEVAGIEKVGETSATITVQDLMYRLNTQIPNRILQASCSWVLYSVGCTLAAASFTATGQVASVSTANTVVLTGSLTPPLNNPTVGTYTLGTLKWTSGANNGLAYFVRQWIAGSLGNPDTVQLDVQPIFPIAVGDQFTITQGCDKSFASCVNLQGDTNSYLNFGGQPTVPVPETAV